MKTVRVTSLFDWCLTPHISQNSRPYCKEMTTHIVHRSSIHVAFFVIVKRSIYLLPYGHTVHAKLAGGALRYKYDKRRNAHVKPIAQHTLVAISGRNSIPLPLKREVSALGTSRCGNASGDDGHAVSLVVIHGTVPLLLTSIGMSARLVNKGKTVTIACKRMNPTR